MDSEIDNTKDRSDDGSQNTPDAAGITPPPNNPGDKRYSRIDDEALRKRLDSLVKKIPTVEKEIKDLEKKFETSNKEIIDKTREEIERSKTSFIESLALFVALFTFISIEFQVFRVYSDWRSIVGVSLLLLGSISFFVVLFHTFLWQWKYLEEKIVWYKNSITISFLMLSLLLTIGGGVFLAFSPQEEKLKNYVKEEVASSAQENASVTQQAIDHALQEKETEALSRVRKCVQEFGMDRRCFK